MGLFTSGIKAAIRQRKRFTVFGILFIFLSGTMILQGLELDSYNTDNLLMARGVVIDNPGGRWITSVLGEVRGEYRVHYATIAGSTDLGLISVEGHQQASRQGELPWILEELKPTKLSKGRFPSGQGEFLINNDYTIGEGGVKFSVAAIGAHLQIDGVDLEVTGIYPEGVVSNLAGTGGAENVIYVHWSDFDLLNENGNIDRGSHEIRRIVLTAKGSYITGSAMENREDIFTILSGQGYDFEGSEKLGFSAYRRMLLQTLFTFVSSLFLAALYSFLMVKFRKNEVATLRAIGWSGKEIKTYVLAELFAIILLSYLISLMFSLIAAHYYYELPITSLITFIGSFSVVLLALSFGWLIISKGVLGVSPMEAFRRR